MIPSPLSNFRIFITSSRNHTPLSSCPQALNYSLTHFLSPQICLFQTRRTHVIRNIGCCLYLAVCVSLSTRFSRFIPVVTGIRMEFFVVAEQYSILVIHPSVNGRLGGFHPFIIGTTLFSAFPLQLLCRQMFSVLSDIYLRVELLCQMAILCSLCERLPDGFRQ